jgi:hypothetical protein
VHHVSVHAQLVAIQSSRAQAKPLL